ncbi:MULTISPECIES: EAL and HDOD domain-containing protein [unclassified Fusibacter]|uniref:EAL and HDOD domain-containing protein n=1 Tax=unclassified Fusibacter TaxID=2624464 RepID=UPI001012D851|nr:MULTISPECIES: HDOD domain-containing protein [unclassified Fusibacter]MCK8059456.1 HDOD domain-containing protein [Fusibacter sp. A2]NPE21080.1 HDOD domain-containing protein [Fusibacter sp. A1]RXV62353.1 HDOD domain-containing protein [Fusibacter sp. A1]
MEQFLARQPIFDTKLNVFAYELLYRSDDRFNTSVFFDGNQATSKVITQSMMVTDFSKLVANKMAFINFTDQLILEEIPLLFDKDKLVVEVLEDVPVTDKLIDAIIKFKLMGYTIALDDMVLDGPTEPLMKYADIVKVDFMMTSPMDRLVLTERLKQFSVKLLAEKVETMTDYREAVRLGYHYFQGYFFAKPDLIKTTDIKTISTSYLRLMQELSSESPDYEKLSKVVESDVSLSFKLLKLINSAAFYRSAKIQTISQALVMLGLKELNKWVMLLMLQEVSADKPDELVRTVLIRGKMMEKLAEHLGLKSLADESFLTGLLSLIDIMTNRSLDDVLSELPLDDIIISALKGNINKLGHMLGLVKSYEQTDWTGMYQFCNELSFSEQSLPTVYFESMQWVEEILDTY